MRKKKNKVIVCKGCGKCCEAIMFKYSLEEMEEYVKKGNEDAKFIVKHWTEISIKEALEINSYLKKYLYKDYFNHLYICDQYDKETKKCRIHNDGKPDVCKNFPFYGKLFLPIGFFLFSEECVFNKPELFNRIEK